MDARQGRGGLRRARGADDQGGHHAAREQARHHRLVHGPDAAHHRQRHGARLVHPAAGAGQRGRVGRRRQHLPRPRQRAGRHRRRPQPRFAARLLRPGRRLVEALRRHLGRRLRVDQETVRQPGDADQERHHRQPLDRRHPGEERTDRPGKQHPRRAVLGPCAQLADPWPGNEEGHGQAGSAGGDRPLPVGHRGHGGHDQCAGRPQPQPRRLPAAGLHAVRDQRLRHSVQPLAAVAREGHRATVGKPQRPHDHVPAGAEAGL